MGNINEAKRESKGQRHLSRRALAPFHTETDVTIMVTMQDIMKHAVSRRIIISHLLPAPLPPLLCCNSPRRRDGCLTGLDVLRGGVACVEAREAAFLGAFAGIGMGSPAC